MTRLQVNVQQAALNATIRKLQSIPPGAGRRALRTGVFKAGSETLQQSKAFAPVGRTGQFKRSLAKKDLRYATSGTYISIVGQRSRKNRPFTPRQQASANRKTGRISKGLSGQGDAPAIHWLERGTSPHVIRARNKKLLAWNIIAGNKKISPPRFAKVVQHPGHKATGFLGTVERRYRARRIQTIRKAAEAELIKLGY